MKNLHGAHLFVVAVLAPLAVLPATAHSASSRGRTTPSARQNQATAALPSCPELARAMETVARNDARLRDWANLARYREANRALTPAKPAEARVVFMGDSITDFWQQPRFGGFFEGRPYVDRGISGQTTPQMLVRFRPDVIALKPRAVVILAGTNDIAGNTGPATDADIQDNLASMCDLAQANGIRVVLASLLPTSAYHYQAGTASAPQTTLRPLSRIIAINEWMKAYAAAHGFAYLDYFSAMKDANGFFRADLSIDDLHPNEKGYAVMAPLAEAAIARALK